ncbi:hypothetical protein ACFOLL_09640 [Falsochrobactrum ovis]|uniref:Uncharacterized protein n=1 Tax=Falsochrobactrum ovis TaxID=1293442 RepID=A0A364JVA3_9HYPH|nr:hypothetical protein [Falsochrobactrum ovis]RAK29043.1 hypothetical protein C7374_10593 [Falsochrobactrum ovis]
MTHILKSEIDHLKTKIDEIKTKVEQHFQNSGQEEEIEALRFEFDDLVNRINSILPH